MKRKKSELQTGDVVQLINKNYALVINSIIVIENGSYITLSVYDENLKNRYSHKCDIIKVFSSPKTFNEILEESKESIYTINNIKTCIKCIVKDYNSEHNNEISIF